MDANAADRPLHAYCEAVWSCLRSGACLKGCSELGVRKVGPFAVLECLCVCSTECHKQLYLDREQGVQSGHPGCNTLARDMALQVCRAG